MLELTIFLNALLNTDWLKLFNFSVSNAYQLEYMHQLKINSLAK